MVKKEETKVNKITDEQLKDVTAKQAQINDAIHRIGMLEVQKEGVKRMLEDVSKEMEEMKKALEEEYGQININLQNGEYTPIEKEEVVEDKESDK
jgi:hypothetical protein